MARKFFNQKVKKGRLSTGTIVIITIFGLLVVIAIAVVISFSASKNKAVIKIRESVAVEINSELPDKTLFFAELENVEESSIKIYYSNVNLAKIGEYKVSLDIYGKTYESKLIVVDTESPELVLKDLSIGIGETYAAKDFVASCSDNSEEECIIDFYQLSLSQDGKKIDYGAYTQEGTYTIQIIAKDAAGNATAPLSTNLTIGKSGSISTSCKYGNSEYDSDKYNLAVNVTENGCALDLNLYQDPNILAPAKEIQANEENKLQNEFKTLNLNVDKIYLNGHINPVMNKTGTGIVGYTLFIELLIPNGDSQELIESYYVNINGGRDYVVNKYGLK